MRRPIRVNPRIVAIICFGAIIVDGFDLVVYGTVAPSLLDYEPWHLSTAQVGAIGSYSNIGMLIGALTVGYLSDRVGRRSVIMVTVAQFSLFSALCAFAPTPEVFGAFRFIAGLGLGGVVPAATALTMESAPPGRQYRHLIRVLVANPIGGVLVALAAIVILPTLGVWAMFLIAALPGILLLPFAYFYLPESTAFRPPAPDVAATAPSRDRRRSLAILFSPGYRLATVLFPLITFSGLLLVYGMNTWLPQIMREAGYGLGSSLSFLLVFNAGAIIGALLVSRVADRFGARPTIAVSFFVAALCVVAMSLKPDAVLLYVFIAVGGFGAIGTQQLVNGFVVGYYPARASATGLGWSLGIGRVGAIVAPLLGGWLLGAAIGLEWNFYVFGAAALVATVFVLLVRRSPVAVRKPVRPEQAGRGVPPVPVSESDAHLQPERRTP